MMKLKQKKKRSKELKKILKERLGIDNIHMLCDDSPDEAEGGNTPRKDQKKIIQSSTNDSYHVLMREIGIDHD